MNIITHRGLEPSRKSSFPESSLAAFNDHIHRGFGIEFDPIFLSNDIAISHDPTLKTISGGQDLREFSCLSKEDIHRSPFFEEIPFIDELLNLINKSNNLSALHLKGKFQENKYLDPLILALSNYMEALSKIIIFDVKPDTAIYIKKFLPKAALAPSVAHPFDIERYNPVVSGTLINIDDALKYKDLYDWVWLDEWDLEDEGNVKKQFYTEENFEKLRGSNFKIALVTPDLHGTSPGLLGGEHHQDSESVEKLFIRMKQIMLLKPDAMCTDYPEEVRGMCFFL